MLNLNHENISSRQIFNCLNEKLTYNIFSQVILNFFNYNNSTGGGPIHNHVPIGSREFRRAEIHISCVEEMSRNVIISDPRAIPFTYD